MSRAIIYPFKGRIKGIIQAPPSKSYTHRFLIIGLLSEGRTRLVNPLTSGDTKTTLEAVKAFGAKVYSETLVSDGEPKEPDKIINCRRSGTTLRFSTAVAALVDGLTILTGYRQLKRRPIYPLINSLKQLGIKAYLRSGNLPIAIIGGKKYIRKHRVEIKGNISSQFISALLIVAPKIGLHITVNGDLVSKPYVDMTMKCMREAGIKIEAKGYEEFVIRKENYKASTFKIPGDYSSAAFILALGALYGKIRVKGLEKDDIQADKAIITLLKEMGANVKIYNNEVEVRESSLKGIEIDCKDMPDLVPILAVLGAYADGKTVIKGVKHIRFKETDRIQAIALNLSRMGAKVKTLNDGLEIIGKNRLRGSVLNSFSDHRIAMATTIAALGAEGRSILINPVCVKDSYPQFFYELSRLGCEVKHHE